MEIKNNLKLVQLKPKLETTGSYFNSWSRRCVVQHMSADVEDFQKVGEKLLHHSYQRALRQSGPRFIQLVWASAGISATTAAFFLPRPRVTHAFWSYSWKQHKKQLMFCKLLHLPCYSWHKWHFSKHTNK